MTDDGRDLLAAYRASVEPPAGAKDEGWAALSATLEGGGAAATAGSTATSVASTGLKLVGALVVVAAIGVTLWFMREPAPANAPSVAEPSVAELVEETEATEVAEPVDDPPPVVEPALEEEAVEVAEPVERAPRMRAEPTETGGLAEELALLRRANAAIRAGDPEAALHILAEHRRRFPGGALRDERDVTNAEALCAAGQSAAARRQALRFLERVPSSPLSMRAQGICP